MAFGLRLSAQVVRKYIVMLPGRKVLDNHAYEEFTANSQVRGFPQVSETLALTLLDQGVLLSIQTRVPRFERVGTG